MKLRVGIWGFGITGMAAARYFLSKGYAVWVMDSSEISQARAKEMGLEVETQEKLRLFLEKSDYLFASGGVNIKMHYAQYCHKWISEVDIFAREWRHRFPLKPIIGITGTVGKTTVTHLIGSLLNATSEKKDTWLIGGNIGVPLFTLLEQAHDQHKGVVIELSSFQLEYSTSFYPDVGILTNIYPNHLDRHASMEEYVNAKLNIVKNMPDKSVIIAPILLRDSILNIHRHKKIKRWFFSDNDSFLHNQTSNEEDEYCYYLHKNCVMRYHNKKNTFFADISSLPSCTFNINWMLVLLGVTALKYDTDSLITLAHCITEVPNHRVCYLGTHKDISFYNDSKATVPESTLAAVERLSQTFTSIHLLLGGESKGVDRSYLIERLQKKVSYIYCFGKEAHLLHSFCIKNNIPSSWHDTLEDAFKTSIAHSDKPCCVLLSPAGSSYDLFKNYQERGERFTMLTKQFMTE